MAELNGADSPVLKSGEEPSAGVATFADVTERKALEEARRQAEERARLLAEEAALDLQRFQAMTDSMVEGMVLIDQDQSIAWANRAAAEMFGMPSMRGERTTPVCFAATFDPCDLAGRPLAAEEWPGSRAVRGETVVRFPVRLRPIGAASPRTLFVSAVPIRLAGSEAARAVVTFRDVTEELAAAESLRLSEESLRSYFDAVEDFVFVVDGAGRIIHANRMALSRLGYSADELAGMEILRLNPEDRRREAEENYSALLAGAAEKCPLPVVMKDGRLIPVESRVYRGRWNGEEVLFGVCRDLSELRAAEEKFEKLFRSNPCPMVLRSLSAGTAVDVNDAFTALLGYSREEVVGGADFGLGLWVDPVGREAALKELREDGRLKGFDVTVRAKDGSLREGHFSAETLEIRGEKLVLTVLNDVTELKRAERELRDHRDRLEETVARRSRELVEASQELGSFSYTVSHDLRAPLRAIHGFSKLLERHLGSGLDDEGRRLLGVVERAATQMGSLVDGLIRYTRIGRAPLRLETVEMKWLVEQVLEELSQGTGPGRLEARVGDLPPVRADRELAAEVLRQVLSNAVKFSVKRPRPTVEVGFEAGPGGTVYFVRDNGVGFDPRYAERIFGVFERLHGPDGFEGTGIGMALARRIVERHGGWIRADGEVDRGATVRFAFGPGSAG